MGLARELSMGPKRPRTPKPGSTGPYARLRTLTDSAAATVAELQAAVIAAQASNDRPRFMEGVILVRANQRIAALGGTPLGPTEFNTY